MVALRNSLISKTDRARDGSACSDVAFSETLTPIFAVRNAVPVRQTSASTRRSSSTAERRQRSRSSLSRTSVRRPLGTSVLPPHRRRLVRRALWHLAGHLSRRERPSCRPPSSGRVAFLPPHLPADVPRWRAGRRRCGGGARRRHSLNTFTSAIIDLITRGTDHSIVFSDARLRAPSSSRRHLRGVGAHRPVLTISSPLAARLRPASHSQKRPA